MAEIKAGIDIKVTSFDKKLDELMKILEKAEEGIKIKITSDGNGVEKQVNAQANKNKLLREELDLMTKQLKYMSVGLKSTNDMNKSAEKVTGEMIEQVRQGKALSDNQKDEIANLEKAYTLAKTSGALSTKLDKQKETAIKKREADIKKAVQLEDKIRSQGLQLQGKALEYEDKKLVKAQAMAEALAKQASLGLEIRKNDLDQLKLLAQKESLAVKKSIDPKKALNDQVVLQKEFERLKLTIVSNGLSKQYLARIKNLKKGNKLELESVKKLQNDVANQLAKKRGQKSNFAEEFTNFMVFREITQGMTQTLGEISQLEDSVYQMGIVAGKSNLEIRGLREEMYDLGSAIPRVTNEIVQQMTAIERTGRTYKEAMGIMQGSSKLAVASGR